MLPDYNIGNYEVFVDNKTLVAEVIYSPSGKPIKKFVGETAWADARRHADDMHIAMGGK